MNGRKDLGIGESWRCGGDRRRVEIKTQGKAERRGSDVVTVVDDGGGRVAVLVAVFGGETVKAPLVILQAATQGGWGSGRGIAGDGLCSR